MSRYSFNRCHKRVGSSHSTPRFELEPALPGATLVAGIVFDPVAFQQGFERGQVLPLKLALVIEFTGLHETRRTWTWYCGHGDGDFKSVLWGNERSAKQGTERNGARARAIDSISAPQVSCESCCILRGPSASGGLAGSHRRLLPSHQSEIFLQHVRCILTTESPQSEQTLSFNYG